VFCFFLLQTIIPTAFSSQMVVPTVLDSCEGVEARIGNAPPTVQAARSTGEQLMAAEMLIS
jgi:hypothetical protein